MALANSTLITVSATYTRLDGRAASGQVFFSSNQVLVNSTSGEIVPPVDFVATLDANGAISIDLPATDDPDYEPQGWTYTVTEDTDGGDRPPFGLSVPADGGAIDLADVAPPGPTESLSSDEYTLLTTFTSHRDNADKHLGDFAATPQLGDILRHEGVDAWEPYRGTTTGQTLVWDGAAWVRDNDTYQQTHMEDVRKHGAVLDRTTNDVAAIQAAIDSFNGERGTVWIDGQALCDGNLDAKRCTLAGKGPPGNAGGGGSLIEFTADNGIYSSIEDAYSYSIDGLQIAGSNGGTPTASGQVLVDFKGQNYPRLRRCRIRDGEVGVRLQDGGTIQCHYGRFFGVDIERCLVGWDPGNGTAAHDHHIYGGRLWRCDTGMLLGSNINSIQLYGVTFESSTSFDIDSTGDDISLFGVYFESPDATNLRVRAGAGEHHHFGCKWWAGTKVVDDNAPGVVSGYSGTWDVVTAVPYRTGWWGYTPGPVTTATWASDRAHYVPIVVNGRRTVDRLACEVTAAGTTGAVVRLGIYDADNTTLMPDKLILDAGTVDATTTGVKTLTISQAVGPGVVWLCCVPQGTPSTDPTVRSMAQGAGGVQIASGSAGALSGPTSGLISGAGAVPGALPDPATVAQSHATPLKTVTRFD